MANRRLPDASKPAESAARRTPGARKSPTESPSTRAQLTAEARRALIAQNAYLRAERRGFVPGHEVEDWLAAEAEVEVLLKVVRSSPQ
jgi:hypothetical protein